MPTTAPVPGPELLSELLASILAEALEDELEAVTLLMTTEVIAPFAAVDLEVVSRVIEGSTILDLAEVEVTVSSMTEEEELEEDELDVVEVVEGSTGSVTGSEEGSTGSGL